MSRRAEWEAKVKRLRGILNDKIIEDLLKMNQDKPNPPNTQGSSKNIEGDTCRKEREKTFKILEVRI